MKRNTLASRLAFFRQMKRIVVVVAAVAATTVVGIAEPHAQPTADLHPGRQMSNAGRERFVVSTGHVLNKSEGTRGFGILYAPSNPDNPTFRAELEAITGEPCDYWDASSSTPTLEDIEGYRCVLTWVGYAYADKVAMGDVLADYVDLGGKVILGQWTYHSDQLNWLEGEIMTAAYCPVTVLTSSSSGAYAGDGIDCVHVVGPVTAYDADVLDVATVIAGASSDGTFDNPPYDSLAVAWRSDRQVYYSPGNTGGTYGSGDWAQLVANMCGCTDESLLGACCDPATGICEDDVDAQDCMPPLQFYYQQTCGLLVPSCGNPGACCIDETAECTQEPEVNCDGRFIAGATCDPDPFDPPCGEYFPCEHSIVMYDDYGDGWNGGFIDVWVDGDLVMAGVTLDSGYGPESVYFQAATGSTIQTFWTDGGWPYECSYYIYDPYGTELCSDGVGGASPTGVTCIGNCEGFGACCDPYTGICIDGTEANDCLPPLQFGYETLCADLVPPCGNPGACCDVYTGECTDGTLELNCPEDFRFEGDQQCAELAPPCGTPGACCDDETGTCTTEYEANCPGRFIAGGSCDPDPFEPPCGELTAACCYPDGSCALLLAADCLEGEWYVEYTTCEPNPCPQEVSIYALPVETTPFDTPTTGVGLGRAPRLDHLGQLSDNPVSGATEASTIGENTPEMETTPSETLDPAPPRRRPPAPPRRRGCEPPNPPLIARVTSSPIFRSLLSLFGAKSGDGRSFNAFDMGLGTNWNYSAAVVMYDPVAERYILVGKDSGVTVFTSDGIGGWTPSAGGFYELTVSTPYLSVMHKSGTVYDFEQMTPAISLPGVPYLLTSVTDPNGNGTSYEYVDGRLVRMTDNQGREIDLTHHPDGHIATITDELGRQLAFEYTGGDLTAIVLPDGERIEYTYDGNHRMTSKTVPGGDTYLINYASDATELLDPNLDLVLSVENPAQVDEAASSASGEVRFTPSTSLVTDGNSQQWQYKYNERGQLTKRTAPDLTETNISYDPPTREISAIEDCRSNLTTYEYDSNGNLIELTDALTNVTVMEYHASFNKITRLIEPDGDEWLYEYDGNGNLITIIDPIIETPTDRVITYEYDSAGLLIRGVDRNSNETTYTYMNSLVASKTVDPGGLNITTYYEYDAMGRRTATTNANGVRTEFTYDAFNRITQIVVDPGVLQHLNLVSTRTYDGFGNVSSEVDPRGVETAYDYDERGRLTQETKDVGGLEVQTWYDYDGRDNLTFLTDALGNITQYEYDPLNRLITIIDSELYVTTYDYDCADNRLYEEDGDGRAIEYEYDSLNRLVAQTVDPGGLALTTAIEYVDGGCGCGTPGGALVHKLTDPDGRVTYKYYDALDRLSSTVGKVGDTDDNGGDADDAITSVEYDYNGNATTITVANSPDPDQVTEFAFDALDRQVSRTLDPGGTALTTAWEYDGVGNVIRQVEVNGNEVQPTYDAANRLLSITDSLGPAVDNQYDANANLLSKTDPNGNGLTYEYDSLNRLTHEYDGHGVPRDYVYDGLGRMVARIDRKGRTTEYEYDSLGRLVRITTPLTSPAPTTEYTYDAAGRRLTQTDANGGLTQYEYDAAGRLVTESHPDTGARTFSYDGAGNRTEQVDQNGDVTSYTYDDLNRLVGRSYTLLPDSPAAPTPVDTYLYDRAGNLTSADNINADLDFDYDGAGRATDLGQDGFNVHFGYGIVPFGSTKNVQYPSGRTITEVRDFRNRLEEVSEGATILAAFSYDGAGRLTSRTYPENNTATSYGLDNNAWITGITHSHAGTPFINLEYGRDNEGNPTYLKKYHDLDNSELYAYDDLDRLTDFDRGLLNPTNDGILAFGDLPGAMQQQVWTDLDPLGNWREQTMLIDGVARTETRGVNTSNQYTHIDYRNQHHDANGNLLLDSTWGDSDTDGDVDLDDFTFFAGCLTGPCSSPPCDPPVYPDAGCAVVDFDADGDVDLEDFSHFENAFTQAGVAALGVTRFTFDVENRLVSVERDGEVLADYAYDALNRRVLATAGGETTTYVYDNHRRVIEERGPASSLEATYVYGAWIDDVIAMDRDDQRYYYHRDAVGSVAAVTDLSGVAVERYTYDAYGRPFVTDAAGNPLPGSTIGNPYMFTGRRYDVETGLYYYRARHYDPLRGRFLHRDPLGYVSGDNLYEYVRSRPTMLVDPLGLYEPGDEICETRTRSLASGSRGGSIGPISWSASFDLSITLEVCVKCCPEGTPRAYQWVLDNSLEAVLSGEASASGSSYGGEIGPFGFWAGVRVSVSVSGTASGKFSSDRCNNREFSGRLCVDARGTLSISGGARAYVDTWLGTVSVGADITGQGTVTLNKCLYCTSSGCRWEPGRVCLYGSVTINVDVLIISGSWTLWSGSRCWTI